MGVSYNFVLIGWYFLGGFLLYALPASVLVA